MSIIPDQPRRRPDMSARRAHYGGAPGPYPYPRIPDGDTVPVPRRRRRNLGGWIAAVAVLVVVIVLILDACNYSRASAAPPLAREHECVKMSQTVTAPIAGYLIRDRASDGRLFYVDSGALTSGLFVGNGGTWELRYQCRK